MDCIVFLQSWKCTKKCIDVNQTLVWRAMIDLNEGDPVIWVPDFLKMEN